MGGDDAISMRGKRCKKTPGEITHHPTELRQTGTDSNGFCGTFLDDVFVCEYM